MFPTMLLDQLEKMSAPFPHFFFLQPLFSLSAPEQGIQPPSAGAWDSGSAINLSGYDRPKESQNSSLIEQWTLK